VLEPCCVYRREHVQLSNGLWTTQHHHQGTHPTAHFRHNVAVESLPFGKMRDFTLQQGLKVEPTHMRFNVAKDAILSGTDIVVKLNTVYWGSKDKIVDYARVSELR
jgi:hypothetical protein